MECILGVEPPVCQSCAHSLTPQPCLSDGERLSLNNIVSLHSDLINRLRRDERFPEMEEQSQCPRGDRRQSAASQPIKSTIPWKTARWACRDLSRSIFNQSSMKRTAWAGAGTGSGGGAVPHIFPPVTSFEGLSRQWQLSALLEVLSGLC